jgi:hypothetical protein
VPRPARAAPVDHGASLLRLWPFAVAWRPYVAAQRNETELYSAHSVLPATPAPAEGVPTVNHFCAPCSLKSDLRWPLGHVDRLRCVPVHGVLLRNPPSANEPHAMQLPGGLGEGGSLRATDRSKRASVSGTSCPASRSTWPSSRGARVTCSQRTRPVQPCSSKGWGTRAREEVSAKYRCECPRVAAIVWQKESVCNTGVAWMCTKVEFAVSGQIDPPGLQSRDQSAARFNNRLAARGHETRKAPTPRPVRPMRWT